MDRTAVGIVCGGLVVLLIVAATMFVGENGEPGNRPAPRTVPPNRADPRTAMYDDGCRGDCLAYELKLNCQQRVREAAVRSFGRPRFSSRSRTGTRVSFGGTQNVEARFTWRSFFTVPDAAFPSREYWFVCAGSGRSGARITGSRITDVELD